MSSSTPSPDQNVSLNHTPSSMPQPSPPTTDVVTSSLSLTFIDLLSMNYDTFREELDQLHALMQYAATNSTTEAYTRFEGLGWWYCITQTPSSYERTNPLWHPLNGPGAYQNMLNQFSNSLDTENIMLELTNNLEYIDTDMTLPVSEYPTTTIDDQAEPATIYPAYFTLKQAAHVRLPPASDTPYPPPCVPPQQANDALKRLHLRLREFERDLPPGFTLGPVATAPTPQTPPSSITPSTQRPKPPTTVPTPCTLPTTPLSPYLMPMTALPTPPTQLTSPLQPSSPASPSPATTQLQHPRPSTTKATPTQRTSSPTSPINPHPHPQCTPASPSDPPDQYQTDHPSPNKSNPASPPQTRSSSSKPEKRIDPRPSYKQRPRPRPDATFGEAPYITAANSMFPTHTKK